jgi:hypothetical protein
LGLTCSKGIQGFLAVVCVHGPANSICLAQGVYGCPAMLESCLVVASDGRGLHQVVPRGHRARGDALDAAAERERSMCADRGLTRTRSPWAPQAHGEGLLRTRMVDPRTGLRICGRPRMGFASRARRSPTRCSRARARTASGKGTCTAQTARAARGAAGSRADSRRRVGRGVTRPRRAHTRSRSLVRRQATCQATCAYSHGEVRGVVLMRSMAWLSSCPVTCLRHPESGGDLRSRPLANGAGPRQCIATEPARPARARDGSTSGRLGGRRVSCVGVSRPDETRAAGGRFLPCRVPVSRPDERARTVDSGWSRTARILDPDPRCASGLTSRCGPSLAGRPRCGTRPAAREFRGGRVGWGGVRWGAGGLGGSEVGGGWAGGE